MATEPTLSDLGKRLGTVERRVNSMDQRLERVETRLEAFQSGTNTFHTAILAEMNRTNGCFDAVDARFDALEKLIRDSLNGSQP